MINATQKTLKGTLLKMVVNFSYPADNTVTLDTIDFYTEWYCKGKKQKIEKEDHVREVITGGVVYYALVDTSIIGDGTLKMRLCANIPDDDAPDGIRPEYAEVTTNVLIG